MTSSRPGHLVETPAATDTATVMPVVCDTMRHRVAVSVSGLRIVDHDDLERIGWVFGGQVPSGCVCGHLATCFTGTVTLGDVTAAVFFGASGRPLDVYTRETVKVHVNRFGLTPRQVWESHPRCVDGQLPPISAALAVDRTRWMDSDWKRNGLVPDLWEAAWDGYGGITPWAARWWTDHGFGPTEAAHCWTDLIDLCQ